jgi:hypothetical protein
MAITLVPEPSNDNPALTDWQRLLSKVGSYGLNIMDIKISYDVGTLTFAQGSLFSISGSLYQFTTPQQISLIGLNAAGNAGYYYVMATPAAGSVTLSLSQIQPTYDALRGGWFIGAAKAIVQLYYRSIFESLESACSVAEVIDRTELPEFKDAMLYAGNNGHLFYSNLGNPLNIELNLKKGLYAFLGRGGSSGNGGAAGALPTFYNNSYYANPNIQFTGTKGEDSKQADAQGPVFFYAKKDTAITILMGRTGGDGGVGGHGAMYSQSGSYGTFYCGGGNGGGGGSGGDTIVVLGITSNKDLAPANGKVLAVFPGARAGRGGESGANNKYATSISDVGWGSAGTDQRVLFNGGRRYYCLGLSGGFGSMGQWFNYTQGRGNGTMGPATPNTSEAVCEIRSFN